MANFKEFIKETQRVGTHITTLKELAEERSLGLIDNKEVFTIVEGVTEQTEYGYFGGIEGVIRKDGGCNSTYSKIDFPVRTGRWSPVPMRINIAECYTTLEGTMLQYMLKKGVSRLDISDSDYISFLENLILGAIKKDFTRLAFFGNKEHSVHSTGSGTQVLRTGVNPEDYNLINGLFTAFEKMTTDDQTKRVTIAENAKNTYAEQTKLAEDTAYNVFTELIDKADPLTFVGEAQPIILATKSLVTNLSRFLRKEFKNELTLSKMEGGYETVEFEGVKIVTHQWLDQIIRRDFNNGTKYNNPHRALLLDKSECQLGIDSLGSLSDLQIGYDLRSDEVLIKGALRADFQRVIGSTGAGAY